ncbi:MAG: preprotein translocase subunit SecA [Gemmatimonadota bacterium]|jgi:preprotein translocase subunit SecA|nr:preprotein translocase subunit SecA [Gemmatimonadota bacterium]MDQ8150824.1 preprotein translocase subunit SecA [Gemmatimonadota bacterium]MDQ8152516.1 preprotein translocase subunit SecA [Gemmatimonadota bacterium]MDQ8169926.1 preprotein translocase subunit SecA [Gemmatimonadota bacterium]MDQ8174132.1 preprotein translocase subunit SecA [Gemmatimonadota bacterium]
MFKTLLAKVIGTRHQREQKRVQPIVDEINEIGARVRDLSDADLRAQTTTFRAAIAEATEALRGRIEALKAEKHAAVDVAAREAIDLQLSGADGQGGLEHEYREAIKGVLDEILPEAFATVREAARRLVGTTVVVTGRDLPWDMVHYDVQMVGGIQLHLGRIAEMATGEGKTLVATLPLYLNALPGRGAHLVTVNSYLARRDSQWMGHLFRWLGLTVGCLDDTEPGTPERRAAYACDITYGTNNEFGFDYLRDNMVVSLDQRVQRPHIFAIVDEVDSVLIDEARTPLIISGPVGNEGDRAYAEQNHAITRLVRKQTELVNDLVAKGERALAEAEGGVASKGAAPRKEAGLLFYQARLGGPKNKRLLKAMQETGVKQLIQEAELAHLADRKLPPAKQEYRHIEEDLLFVLDEKGHSVHLTDRGVDFLSPDQHDEFVLPDIATAIGRLEKDLALDAAARLEARRQIETEYALKSEKLNIVHQLLRAHALYEKDVNYVVQDAQVLIVDEFTGRTMPGRRWSEGLHQAVEAKEGVQVKGETQTLATITIQNYFRLYEKLAGMTGTAETEETEFFQIYGLEVAVIPTNRAIVREDRHDLVYKTRREKYNGIVEETRRLHGLGFPVLVGTTSVEASETLSRLFQRGGLPHNVLNAKYHQREAEIVALAGQPGAITIATNMAGRGTDIKLGAGVREAKASTVKDPDGKEQSVTEPGGLHIIGSERHESRRIDRQLRGRAGRQGDPGSSQFFLSLEDDLMRLFGSDRIARLMDSLGAQEGEVLTHPLITRSIEQAQKRVELQNFQSRKRLLDYDDVMNQQREVIYSLRSFALDAGEELRGEAERMVGAAVARRVEMELGEAESPEAWDLALVRQELLMQYLLQVPAFESEDRLPATLAAAQEAATEAATTAFHAKIDSLGEFASRLLSLVMLNVLDEKWKDHLYDLDQLRAAIGYRSWGQKDPLVEYKQEAFSMFEDLMRDIQHTFAERFLKVQLVFEPPPSASAPSPVAEAPRTFDPFGVATPPAAPVEPPAPRVVGAGRGVTNLDGPGAASTGEFADVGRNDPCPCGSGKKFKKCHGA